MVYSHANVLTFGRGSTHNRDTRTKPIPEWHLLKRRVSRWAIITAWNPYSRKSSDADNQEANLRLKSVLDTGLFRYLAAEGQGLDSPWPAESSFFIWNIPAEKAAKIGRQFKQNAIVAGRSDESARLQWLAYSGSLS